VAGVPGGVHRHGAELVVAAEPGRIPARLVRIGRVGPDRCEGAAARGPLLEADGADSGAEIQRGGGEMDVRSADDRAAWRIADRGCGRGVVDERRPERAQTVEAGAGGRDRTEVV